MSQTHGRLVSGGQSLSITSVALGALARGTCTHAQGPSKDSQLGALGGNNPAASRPDCFELGENTNTARNVWILWIKHTQILPWAAFHLFWGPWDPCRYGSAATRAGTAGATPSSRWSDPDKLLPGTTLCSPKFL